MASEKLQGNDLSIVAVQTKRQIKQLLLSAGVRPNGHLGQHFLIDLNLMRLLVDSADIQKNDVVLEVGCGTGSLTQGLVERAGRTVAVEVDRSLFQIAEKQLVGAENLDLIHSDILESKHRIARAVTEALATARRQLAGRFLLVANLPYNVASALMMNLLMGPTIADAMVVTVQKEVAERMTAEPGSGHYGTLSIFLSATGDMETIRILKPSVFWPHPRVDSAMVRFTRNPAIAGRIADIELFSRIVHLFMGHRRKTVLACTRLADGGLDVTRPWADILEQSHIDATKRPEELSADDYVALTNSAPNCRF
ncbi:MAG: 16S rRNA (adenine(1518)-N(6)/adenine(1519)-N(6))-dimethyltransferase RsmA [Sedimentisphaerales bacterium]